GTVSVELGPGGQPRFIILEDVAWDRITAEEAALAAAGAAYAVCFGSLAQRAGAARRAVRRLVGATRPAALRVFDVNLRPPFIDREVIEGSLALADVLKLNDQEALMGPGVGARFSGNLIPAAHLCCGVFP